MLHVHPPIKVEIQGLPELLLGAVEELDQRRLMSYSAKRFTSVLLDIPKSSAAVVMIA